ncbi:MAG: SDR family NAD(P)-dependent oxidoreductase [Actinomycetota bacterium]
MSGQVILITGASTGIGHASAKTLIEAGHTVYGAARRIELMNDLVEAGGHPIHMDVDDDASVKTGVDQVIAEQGRIAGLFANAGYCLLGPAELHAGEEVTKQFDTNVVGMGRAVSAVLPHMRKQGSGTITITSSVAGHVSMSGMAWYAATKHAQQGYADGLRMELKEFGINVALIEPGYIDTDIDNASLPTLDRALANPESAPYKNQIETFRQKWSAGIDSGASPDTIAKVVKQAFESDKPRRRYHPNTDARAGIFIKRWLGSRVLDRMLPGQSIR